MYRLVAALLLLLPVLSSAAMLRVPSEATSEVASVIPPTYDECLSQDMPLMEHDGTGLHGVIYAYGRRIEPPYVFTGLDADTLRLNGVGFLPHAAPPKEYGPKSVSGRRTRHTSP